MFHDTELSTDIFPNKLTLLQPINGFRSGSDALLLVNYFLSNHFITKKNNRILDIGCGSGAVSLSLAKQNSLVHVTGLEIQDNYCELAIKNAFLNGLSSRFHTIHGDLDLINTILPPDSFDFVITNPPFYAVTSGRLSPDIGKQIAHHGTIDLIQWIRKSLYPLRNGGVLTIICRTDRLGDIYMALHKRAGNISIKPIITGNANQAKRIILSCQKASKGGTKIVFP